MLIGIDASRAFSNFVGGPENYSYYLIRAMLLANSPHRFRLYLRADSSKSPRYDTFLRNLPTTNPASAGPRSDGGYQLQTVSWPFLWTQGGLALECLLNPPDVLFVPAHTIPLLRLPGLKTVVTIHDLGAQFLPNYHKFPQKYYLNFATIYAIKQATKIIAVSNYTKKDISERLGVGSEKVAVVYEGYDRSMFYPRSGEEIARVTAKYGIKGNYFLFVGTIQPRKNLVRLIEAFSQLSIVNYQLVIAGSQGWLYDEIYAAPERYGVKDSVKFTGKIPEDDLPALMSGCRAFVFPSLYEGFGLSLLEALACGAITVTSNVTSLPEVGGEASFYADPNDTRSITEALRAVLNISESEKEKKRKEGLSQADNFSWEKSAKEVLSLLDSM